MHDRGQTSFDFAVGMGLFLITLAFLFTFVPGIFAPFTVGTGGDEIIADRSADRLAEDLLLSNETQQYRLNTSCTVAFFNTDSDSITCQFSNDASNLHQVLGIDTFEKINVTIKQDGSVLTIQSTKLSAGPSPPESGDVTVATRVVYLNGNRSVLQVKIW
ncbi:MAG: hypothetical protein ABEI86_06670 [Halobacteriaceae archaeon]